MRPVWADEACRMYAGVFAPALTVPEIALRVGHGESEVLAVLREARLLGRRCVYCCQRTGGRASVCPRCQKRGKGGCGGP